MEEKKNILNDLHKHQKPEVPQGFFENFSDELMAKIAEQESGLNAFQKTTKPDVPAEFFETFAKNITTPSEDGQQTGEQQPTEQVKRSRVISLRVVGIISAAAACLLVMFLLKPEDTNVEVASTETEMSSESEISDEELLAYVDENDIIDYILDEEIEIEETSATESTNESSIETESTEQLEDLNDEDILYYFEGDLDDINIEDLDL